MIKKLIAAIATWWQSRAYIAIGPISLADPVDMPKMSNEEMRATLIQLNYMDKTAEQNQTQKSVSP